MLSIPDLLHSLTLAGLRLALEGEILKVKGQVERLTPTQKQSLSTHKPTLIEMLEATTTPSPPCLSISENEALAIESLIESKQTIVELFELRERLAEDCSYGYEWTTDTFTFDYIRYVYRNRLRKVVESTYNQSKPAGCDNTQAGSNENL